METAHLFAGAGGGVLGFEKAGFDTALSIDNNEYAVKTLRENFDSPVAEVDLSETPPEEFSELSDVEGIVGGPPCQDFSVANRYTRGGEKTNLVFVFADWVIHHQPDFFVMENVAGIKSTGDVFERLCSYLSDYYTLSHSIRNSWNYGTPQKRKRMFLVGFKNKQYEFTEPNSVKRTVGDVFTDLPVVEAGESSSAVLNHKAPNHQQKTIDRISKRGAGEELYDSWTEKIRLDPEKPAPTLKAGKRANYHFAHSSIPRGLTVRERARLQDFPDNHKFIGPITEQRKQTGNAVPVRMMSKIAADIKDQI